ncbi:MAG: glycosyltransferase [Chloroflexota bacterium]|nr:glycosyltransferase [Chloroflexota bacterium]
MDHAPTTPLILLRLNGEQVLDVTYHATGRVTTHAPRYRRAVREFAHQIAAHPDALIAWYDTRLAPFLSPPHGWPALLAHPLEVLHLGCVQGCDRMAAALGYVDFHSPFLLAGPTDHRFATWLISPLAGIATPAALRAVGFDRRWSSWVSALFDCGYRGLAAGLCPLAEPGLLATPIPATVLRDLSQPLTTGQTGQLIGRLYGRKWLLFWPLASRRVPLRAIIAAWRMVAPPPLDRPALVALAPPLVAPPPGAAVAVIVPTLGRPQHLATLLGDLAAQTVLPQQVWIIEQDPVGVGSALTDLVAAAWPFAIHHERVRWAGACRARNRGLAAGNAPWVLLLDDDVRLLPAFLAYLLAVATTYNVAGVNGAVYLPGQDPATVAESAFPRLWVGFGTCAALIARQAVAAGGNFDLRLEGGYGEDTEFGIRLRLAGATVLYAPGEPTLHLKAPVGGFRYSFPHPWHADPLPPRPSPTVFYAQQKHGTPAMQAGYHLFYTVKRLTAVRPYGWPAEGPRIRRQWRSAQRWAAWLAAQEG